MDVASRVRTLTIWPVAVQTAIHDVPRTPQERAAHPLLREIIKLLRRLRPRRRPQTGATPSENLIGERYRSVENAGQGLCRVENLNLHWPKGKGSTDPPDETLFSAMQPIFGSNLRTLLLEMPLMVFAKAHTYLTDVDHLEELDLTLSVDRTGVEFKESHKDAVHKALIPFINGVSSSLRALTITIHNHLDLSPLFCGFGKFQQLTRLILIIPFDLYHIPDPSGWNRLLVNHPNLKELYIRHQSCCRSHESPSLVDGEIWVQRCFRDISFTGLKTLSLGLNDAFHLKFANAMAPLAQSLMSLTLTEPCLRYSDVDRVLTALATPQLSSLSLFVDVLTPQLLILFAEKCPNLEQLDLNIEKCRRFDEGEGPHDEVSRLAQALEIIGFNWIFRLVLLVLLMQIISTVASYTAPGNCARLLYGSGSTPSDESGSYP